MRFNKGINTTYINNTDPETSTRPAYPYATKTNLIPFSFNFISSSYMLLNSWVKFVIFQQSKWDYNSMIFQLCKTHINTSNLPFYGYFIRRNRHLFIYKISDLSPRTLWPTCFKWSPSSFSSKINIHMQCIYKHNHIWSTSPFSSQ